MITLGFTYVPAARAQLAFTHNWRSLEERPRGTTLKLLAVMLADIPGYSLITLSDSNRGNHPIGQGGAVTPLSAQALLATWARRWPRWQGVQSPGSGSGW